MTISERLFLALNAIYLRKMGNLVLISECSGLDLDSAQSALEDASSEGFIIDLDGQFLLDDAGRRALLQFYDETYGPLRSKGKVTEWYQRFELLNAEFLKAISGWQMSGGDTRMHGKLLRLVERLVTAIGQISAEIPRYRTYEQRFTAAMDRVDLGNLAYMTSPEVDSIHNIWFEFHEDILAVIGKPRETVEE
jgi:hypothetical protein